VIPEGCVSAGAPSIDTPPRESSDLVTTLWLAGRGVYCTADARRFELVSVTSAVAPINRHFVAQLVCRPHPEVFGSIDTTDATYSAARNSATTRVYRNRDWT
jgi:hypothetical protein